MQLVKYGPKEREVRVPAGWNFVKVGCTILQKDRFFNPKTHAFDPVELEADSRVFDQTLKVQTADIIIRQYRNTNIHNLELDNRLVKVSN